MVNKQKMLCPNAVFLYIFNKTCFGQKPSSVLKIKMKLEIKTTLTFDKPRAKFIKNQIKFLKQMKHCIKLEFNSERSSRYKKQEKARLTGTISPLISYIRYRNKELASNLKIDQTPPHKSSTLI